MPPPDVIDLIQEPKIQPLQKLTRWMLIDVRADIRTGLLREPAPDAIDFAHRTFQDYVRRTFQHYLSARAAVERHDFDFVIEHAHRDDREEVIRMSPGRTAIPGIRSARPPWNGLGSWLDRPYRAGNAARSDSCPGRGSAPAAGPHFLGHTLRARHGLTALWHRPLRG